MAAACAFLALGLTGSAAAATYTPTTFADEAAGDTDPSDCNAGSSEACSLREAVTKATSADSPTDDTIVLAAGTYELDPERITIEISNSQSGKLVIRGAGARATTIDANANANDEQEASAFDIREGMNVDIEDLAITGADFLGPGAVNVAGGDGGPDANVTLTRVRIHGNHAHEGGAISNSGKVTLVQSLIDDNSADSHGGGIRNDDELTIVNSTITGNESGGSGGGIWNTGQGAEGGVSFETLAEEEPTGNDIPEGEPFVRAENSTIAFNKAAGNGGGVATAQDFCDIYPEYFCEGEGSVRLQSHGAFSTARFHNSIVSDNEADGDANCYGNAPADSGAHTSSEGHNLEDGDSCLFTGEGDLDDASGLAALADNGGPTNTHKLNDDSAAIDAAESDGCPAVDQRGTTRPQREGCDIGAFELEEEPEEEQPQQPEQPQTPIQQPQTPEARGPRCLDTQPPLTTMDRDGLRVTPTTVTLSGISRDRGRPCASGVQRVEVSLARVSGTDLNCRFMRSSNRFLLSPFQNCRRPIRFVADGTSQWQFRFRIRLEPGTYRAQARGYDEERNKETPKKRQNIVKFTVK